MEIEKEQQRMKEISKIKYEIICKALGNNLSLSKNYEKIANAKYLLFASKGLDFFKCPCDSENPERSCISKKCMEEINKNGICHCGCFKKKKNKKDGLWE